MIDWVQSQLNKVADICRKHQVKRLELFGSAASGKWDPAHSDIDFFVEFQTDDWQNAADRWFGLHEDLESLLHAKIDLVDLNAAKNPYFLQSANQHKTLVYAN